MENEVKPDSRGRVRITDKRYQNPAMYWKEDRFGRREYFTRYPVNGRMSAYRNISRRFDIYDLPTAYEVAQEMALKAKREGFDPWNEDRKKESESPTFDELFNRNLEALKVKEGTRKSYRSFYNKHLKDKIGDKKVAWLMKNFKYVDDILQEGLRTVPSSFRVHFKPVLQVVFKPYVKERVLNGDTRLQNPVSLLEVGKPVRVKQHPTERLGRRAVDIVRDIFGRLVEWDNSDRTEIKTYLLLHMFLVTRPSELGNLRVGDVDLERGVVFLNAERNKLGERVYKPIVGELGSCLKSLMAGKEGDERLFGYSNGTLQRYANEFLKGLPGEMSVDLHEFRHLAVTAMLENGVSKEDALLLKSGSRGFSSASVADMSYISVTGRVRELLEAYYSLVVEGRDELLRLACSRL